MKKMILSVCLGIFIYNSYAQGLVSPRYQQARDLYNSLAYSEAIPLLVKECTGKNNDFLEALILLADCYRQTNQYAFAEKEYEHITQDKRLKDDMQKLYYAQVLQNNKNYDKAVIWYAEYIKSYPDDRRAINQMQACKNTAQFITDNHPVITNMAFNTNGYDFGTTISGNTLYYTSTGGKTNDLKQKDINLWTGERFMNVYAVNIIENDTTSDEYSTPVLLPATINSKFNEGPMCFSKDKKKVYFTRNQYNPGENIKLAYSKEKEANLSIYEATVDNAGNWINIKSLPFNSKQYSCGHPVLDEENSTLYFSSNMPGGFGNADIWKVKFKDGGIWENPVNLGASVNTNGDEMFPVFDNDKTFYFASDGLGGLGGLDIFSAKIKENGEVEALHNIGTPINSSYDDFAYLPAEDKVSGFFSSDRPNGKGGDDIYRFSNVRYYLDVLVLDKFTGQPLATSQVVLKADEKPDIKLTSDTKGNSSTQVEPDITYAVLSEAPDYLPAGSSKFIAPNEKKPLNNIIIELQPLVVQVTVINSVTKKPIEAAAVKTNTSCDKNFAGLTDINGKVSFMVKNNCTYEIDAIARTYLPKAAIQITTTLKDTTFVVIELEQVNDKPVVLNNIYYDFDKWNIRMDAEPDLKMLLSFMQNNPEAMIELSSHTDARGDDKYNLELSQKRAQSAVYWLVMHGVNANNIKPVGYGEVQPVNNCTNNIVCTEEQHQRNRRTEFRVLNAGQVIASQVKQDIIVNPCKNCPF